MCICPLFFCFVPVYVSQTIRTESGILPFIVLGLIVNGLSIVFFPSLFFKPVLHGICGAAKWLVNKIGFLKKRFHLLDSIDRFEADFGSYTDDFKQKKKSLLAGILLSIPQFILQMSVIYFIFRAFGYREVNYFEIFAIQSLLQVSVSFMPMPGAFSGAQEIGFSSYFKNYFVNNDLYAAVMVWRFFTYYLVVIAGALLVVADQFLYRRKQLHGSVNVRRTRRKTVLEQTDMIPPDIWRRCFKIKLQ